MIIRQTRRKLFDHLHDLHLHVGLLLPPPQVRVEHDDVGVAPGAGMLLDLLRAYDPVLHPVDDRVVAVRFQYQRRPVKVDRRIVFLKETDLNNVRVYMHQN